ncbi:MAG: RNA methyltransferase [Chloroflexota bacterium]
MISSPQNEKVKLARALQDRAKTRRKEGKIVLEGARLVRDAMQQGLLPDFILATPDSASGFLATFGIESILVSDEIMREISATQQPQGILGVFPMPTPTLPPDASRIVILDSIRDPGNLGTILRTSAAAGVQAILLSPTCVDPYNPKALRGGMGAHFRVPVIESDWDRIATYCYNKHIYVADSEGDLAYDTADWSSPWALIIGGEADGAGHEALALAQHRVYIPMAAATESLNAAIATGVILFESARQRALKS